MLLSSSPSKAVSAASEPGTSGISTARRTSRLLRTRPRCKTEGEDHHVDVAAAQHQRGLANGKRPLGENRRQRGRAGAFGHGLLDFEEGEDRSFEVAFGDGGHTVHQALDDGHGQGARRLHGDSLGYRAGPCRHWRAVVEAVGGSAEALRLHADDEDLRAYRLGRHGDAGDQAAAADGHDQRVEIGRLFQQLKAEGALPRDHGLVVVGVYEGQFSVLGQALGEGRSLREAGAMQQHFGAEHARLLHLGVGRGAGHDDGDRYAQPRSVMGQRLRMVSGGHGHDAAATLRRVHGQQPIQGAAFLERCGELQILELEVQLRAELGGQHGGTGQRRLLGGVPDAFAGCFDGLERHCHGIGLRCARGSVRRMAADPTPAADAKRLLIVYHTQTGRTRSLAKAAFEGATDPLIDGVVVRWRTAREAGPDDLLWAHGLVLATPENFGYMSGGMKDFLDRTFYAVEGKIQPLPYAALISAGNDGRGALRAIRRIVGGYPFVEVQEPLIARGEVTDDHLRASRELGMALAAGLEAGIF